MPDPAVATEPAPELAPPIRVDSALYQGIIRGLRFIGATVVGSLVVAVPQLLGIFHLDPAYDAILIPLVGGFLQGLGKVLRGPSIDVGPGQIIGGGSGDVPESVPSTPGWTDKLPV